MLRARAYLRSHPRATLLLVLSFALGVLRPALTSIAHQHAGGEHAHIHLDAVAERGAPAVAGARGPASAHAVPGGAAFAAAHPHGLHTHLLSSFTLARLPDLPAAADAQDLVAVLAPQTPARPRAGVLCVGHARAPPALLT